MDERARAIEALQSIPPDLPRDEWHEVGRAAIASGLSIDDIDSWSRPASNYRGRRDVEASFKTVRPSGGTGPGTLFHYARKYNFRPSTQVRPTLPPAPSKKEPPKPVKQAANSNAAAVWDRCIPATDAEPYIYRKQGKPDGLRVYPASPPLIIRGQNVAGYLVVPCWDGDKLQTLQFISKDKGDKLNMAGASFGDGSFVVGDLATAQKVFIVEGVGQAWAINRATGAAAVVCFGAGRMARVAKVLREKHPAASLVIVPDKGKEAQAAKIAADVAGTWVAMPADKPSNYDANDLMQEQGADALRALLERPQAPLLPLDVVFADELTDSFSAPDELVEGLLTVGGGSLLFGDSNCGKTFLAVDLACAVARVVEWMGRKTEQGLVVYLAAESPASVMTRLYAYQKHHGVTVPNFAVVKNPIDLYASDADTEAVIQAVRLIEHKLGQKARLIIGDTLARLAVGANENSAEAMSLVVRRFDYIRSETEAHFMLIHHSGKNQANGARGWSGLRAAVDTEIEVSDTPAGRCAEITKQRDLPTKGVRIGFTLAPIHLGVNKWGAPVSSCVVQPAAAPDRPTGKRLSEVGGAVLEFLKAQPAGIRKVQVAKHFDGTYAKCSVYRELKKLIAAGAAIEAAGIVSATGVARSAN